LSVRLVGLALMEKSFGGNRQGHRPRVSGGVPVPVTVIGVRAGRGRPSADGQRRAAADWIGLGLKVQLAPLGHPLVERVTDCALPDVIVVEMVLVPEAPWLTVRLLGARADGEAFVGAAGQFDSLKLAIARLPVERAIRRDVLLRVPQGAVVARSTAIML